MEIRRILRLLIINKIICAGGNPETGIFQSKFVDITHSIGVSSAVVSKIWKRYCFEGTVKPLPHSGGNPSHFVPKEICNTSSF